MWKQKLWSLFYPNWPQRKVSLEDGYSLLLPVPGDLPVFLEIALEVFIRQHLMHALEIIVIPDHTSDVITKIVAKRQRAFSIPCKLVELPLKDRFFIYLLNNPGHNHWLQHIRGVENAKASYVLFHDADLFLFDAQFIEKHFQNCSEGKKVCCGISPPWDPWFANHGFKHLVATWEMIASIEWYQSFLPWEHHPQKHYIKGEEQLCDLTFWPQLNTPPEKIGLTDAEGTYIHFNYVISTFRQYQKAQSPFEDTHFRLLLIRLLSDTFEQPVSLPSLDQMLKGFKNADSKVTYLNAKTRAYFPEFYGKLETIAASGLFSPERTARLNQLMEVVKRN